MSTRANDHQGIRVGEMERSIRFYAEAFGAEPVTRPFTIEGEFAEEQFEGPTGVSYRLCHLRFASGLIELFEFTEPREETVPVHPTRAGIMHVGFVVDDVEATVERVTAAGGRLVFPVTAWGANRLTYVTDPDGNVIEIADAPLEELLVGTLERFPEADPGKGADDDR
jgi:catechol 2,3-dioxygenase-like lactoylglutathione lyase family enzyme